MACSVSFTARLINGDWLVVCMANVSTVLTLFYVNLLLIIIKYTGGDDVNPNAATSRSAAWD